MHVQEFKSYAALLSVYIYFYLNVHFSDFLEVLVTLADDLISNYYSQIWLSRSVAYLKLHFVDCFRILLNIIIFTVQS
jgi:hypothetical protein